MSRITMHNKTRISDILSRDEIKSFSERSDAWGTWAVCSTWVSAGLDLYRSGLGARIIACTFATARFRAATTHLLAGAQACEHAKSRSLIDKP